MKNFICVHMNYYHFICNICMYALVTKFCKVLVFMTSIIYIYISVLLHLLERTNSIDSAYVQSIDSYMYVYILP